MQVRSATHAGTWYEDDEETLTKQLGEWLDAVDPSQIPNPPLSVIDVGIAAQSLTTAASSAQPVRFPVKGLKAIIAPHAGYSYSGPSAAWAYKAIDPSAFDRVFILGPSHHVYLDRCALSACSSYKTPIGELKLDLDTIGQLRKTAMFAKDMDLTTDEDEHSIEMHLPYVRKVFQDKPIKIVPILVGSISAAAEASFGELLAPYLADERTLFVVSSDFCHWGSRFRYTYYRPGAQQRPRSLGGRDTLAADEPPIHASIRALDGAGMAELTYPAALTAPDARNYRGTQKNELVQAADPAKRSARDAQKGFAAYLRETNNTICGRHPIGVLMGALTALEAQGMPSELRFTRYAQSSRCSSPRDSSVSYASAFARSTG